MTNVLSAYSSNDATFAAVANHIAERITNLDAGMSIPKIVNLINEFFTRGDKIPFGTLPLIKAFDKYLKEELSLEQLEPIMAAKIFRMFSKISCESSFKSQMTTTLIEHLHKHMNQLQEQSVILCMDGINMYNQYNGVKRVSQLYACHKFTRDLN